METLQAPPPVEQSPTDLMLQSHQSVSLSHDLAIVTPLEMPAFDVTKSELPTTESALPLPTGPEADLSPSERSLRQRIGGKVVQIAKAESLGTAFDVATMAVGIPVSMREAAGSAIDYKMYGKPTPEDSEATQPPSRMKKLRRAAATVALYAGTGILAQKYGSEFAQSVSDHLSDGVAGDYVIPLASKLGAVTGVNSVINKVRR